MRWSAFKLEFTCFFISKSFVSNTEIFQKIKEKLSIIPDRTYEMRIYLGTSSFIYNILLYKYIDVYNLCTNTVSRFFKRNRVICLVT